MSLEAMLHNPRCAATCGKMNRVFKLSVASEHLFLSRCGDIALLP